jgi:hypothetical protein
MSGGGLHPMDGVPEVDTRRPGQEELAALPAETALPAKLPSRLLGQSAEE